MQTTDRQTTAAALREVRKPGKVYAQVLVHEDVRWVEQIKAEIVWQLERSPSDAPSPWEVERTDGSIYLHTA